MENHIRKYLSAVAHQRNVLAQGGEGKLQRNKWVINTDVWTQTIFIAQTIFIYKDILAEVIVTLSVTLSVKGLLQ